MTDEKKSNQKNDDSTTPKKEGNQSYSGNLQKSKDNSYKGVKSKFVTIQFRENRKFDLHIGRNLITFLSRESKKIPAEYLNHKDWQNVKKYFVIKGV